MRHLSVRERYGKLCELVPECTPNGSDSDRWLQKGHELSIALLELDTDFHTHAGQSLLEACLQWMGWHDGTAMTQWQMLDRLYQAASQLAQLRVLSVLIEGALERVGMGQGFFNPLARLSGMNGDGFNQWLYESRCARFVSARAGSPDAAQVLDMDMIDRHHSDCVDWTTLIESGQVVVYQPENTSEQNFCARALKAGFFQACMTRNQLTRPVFYIVDEFQRFVTQEGDSSEVHFLDRCRAYRVNCVLATQSYASLLTVYQRQAELDCLINNIPTLLVFRTKDTRARELLWQAFNPSQRDCMHVLTARPIEQLRTGEYYHLSPVGRGRVQAQRPLH